MALLQNKYQMNFAEKFALYISKYMLFCHYTNSIFFLLWIYSFYFQLITAFCILQKSKPI